MAAGEATSHPILSLNSGSSSLKFALYQCRPQDETLLAQGAVERIGLQDSQLWLELAGQDRVEDPRDFPTYMTAVEATFDALRRHGLPQPGAVGHRLVHGGPDDAAPARVDTSLLDLLRTLIPFAPLHLPSAIEGIAAVAQHFPGLPQVACFDTAFHWHMPEVAQRLPLTRDLWHAGVRRYGFHGLSYEYVMERLGAAASGRVILAHLGNGTSMTAVRHRQALDTTMGFTPTGGMMMGTRSGDLDPGVLLYLMQEQGYGAHHIEQLVNHQAGLLGISGLSSDMQTLLDNRANDPHAAQAVELYCYQLRKHIGALTAVLGGLDTLVFTGGIGERAAPVRWEVCQGLDYLGIRLDPQPNARHADTITTPQSPCTVRVIPTNEDLMIARHTYRLLGAVL